MIRSLKTLIFILHSGLDRHMLYRKGVIMTAFERFQQYGRIRSIMKSVDEYAILFERDNHLYVALSTNQVITADKFTIMPDKVVKDWLQLLFDIKMGLR